MHLSTPTPATLIGTAGVALLLLAFLLQLARRLRADSAAYLLLNLVGALLACWSSYLIRFWPFVVLEATWAAVAAVGLARLSTANRPRAMPPVDEHADGFDEADDDDGAEPSSLVVELPITDELDLHPFRPAETADVLREYLDAAIGKGFSEVRIVHGRGIGTQREIVRKILARDARVAEFADAPAERGGWGATVAKLRKAPERPTDG